MTVATIARRGKINSSQRPFDEHRTAGLLNIVVILAIATVAYTDWVVIANVSLGYLYILPIALSGLVNPLPITISIAVGCTVLQDIFGPPPDSVPIRAVHIALGLAGFLIVGFLVTLIAKQRDRLAMDVKRQRDEYEHDLMLASQVQRRVLPPPAKLPGVELAAFMQTARLLGGDYYDFFQISDHVVDIVIADVSGKGAAASLLMPSLAAVLRSRARELSGPAAVVKDLDDALKQITGSAMFVTMFYARFDQVSRILTYASGGHNPPLLMHARTGDVSALTEAGPILGILPDPQYSDAVVILEPGDILTMFTDGITEQENAAGDEFSTDRLEQAVLSAKAEPSAAIAAHIVDAVSNYAASVEQADDLTIVVARVL